MSFYYGMAFAAVLTAAPLAAQTTNEAAPPPATAPATTQSPPPASDAVGPPQLRDFNLNGVVTQPAQPPAQAPAPTATPTPAPRATPPRNTPAPVTTAPAPRPPAVAALDRDPSPDEVTVDLPPPTTAPVAIEAPVATPAPAPLSDVAPPTDASSTAWWPWVAVLLAVALGTGLLWWRRQKRGREHYATDHAALGALVATPDAAPAPLPRAAATPPRPAPAPSPAPAPAPAPMPEGIITSRLAPDPPMSDGIIASRLKPELAFELLPIRAEAVAEGVSLTVDIIVNNRGSAAARDVLIETVLVNAGAQVDAAVGRFFQQPAGNGDRLPLIGPMSRVAVRARISVASADIAPLVVEGRNLLVPVVAINAHYRWGAGDVTESSSFLIGRGDAEGGKMAPFRLDMGPRSWSDLGARLHSSGLERV